MQTFNHLVKPVEIQQRYGYLITTKMPVSFTELCPYSPQDIQTVKKWKYIVGRDSGMSLMCDMFEYQASLPYSDAKTRFFATTRQREDLELLKPSAILSMIQTTKLDKDCTSIDNIQVNPFHMSGNPYTNLKRIGKASIESVLRLFKDDEFRANVPRALVEYFQSLGFNIADSLNKGDILMIRKKGLKLGL